MSKRPAIGAEALPWFVARRPLLDSFEFAQWSRGLPYPSENELDDAALIERVAAQRATLRRRLHEILSRPLVREAVWIATPDLSSALGAWDEDIDTNDRRLERSAARYFARMTNRATPFGLFASVGFGVVADETRYATGAGTVRRHARTDMGVLAALCAILCARKDVREQASYSLNDTACRTGDRLQYVAASDVGGSRRYRLEAVEVPEFLEAILSTLGARPAFAELVETVCVAEPDVTADEAAEFLHELIDTNLIVPDIEALVTGEDALTALVERLATIPAAAVEHRSLTAARDAIKQLNALPSAAPPDAYDVITQHFVAAGAPTQAGRTFQIDSWVDLGGTTLGQNVVSEILQAADCLRRISASIPDPMNGFASAFTERYDRREMPLLEVLDEDTGIGFPDLGPAASVANMVEGGRRRGPLAELLWRAAEQQLVSVELDEQTIQRMSAGAPTFPATFGVVANVVARSEQDVRDGDFVVSINSIAAPSAATWLGRFCHLDNRLLREVRAMLLQEDALYEGALPAEIVHMPQGRVANVLCRPLMRALEIPCLGASGAPAHARIALADITVSVRDGRVRLWSESRNAEVLPRLSTAHNVAHPRNQTLYRFLSSLRDDGGRLFPWSWGDFGNLPFLPRVSFGKAVLSRATWRVAESEVEEMAKAPSDAVRVRRLVAWRAKRRIPRYVQLLESDNKLAVDLENAISVDVFLHAARRGGMISEMIPEPDQSGTFPMSAAEYFVPYIRRASPEKNNEDGRLSAEPDAGPPDVVTRSFYPGSEWCYAKIYTGLGTIDRIIIDAIAPMIQQLREAGDIDGWFFLRYSDPEPHIRVRMHRTQRGSMDRVMAGFNALIQPFLDNGRVWKIQLDTYVRETERYGGPQRMLIAEQVFSADSDCVAALVVANNDDDPMPSARLLSVLAGIHSYYNAVPLDLAARCAFLEALPAPTRDQRSAWSKAYRQNRKRIADALDPSLSHEARGFVGSSAIAEHEKRLSALLQQMFPHGVKPKGRDALVLSSLTHMFVNRTLRAGGPSERHLYDMLLMHYKSVRARSRDAGC